MMMKMRLLAGVAIPAEQTVALAPGGIHIMTFAKAGSQYGDVMVGKVGAIGPPPAAD
jgi:copper(I)-binding protein